MPVRLVYSPKAYVYTRDAQGNLYDLTEYVTGGQVERKINQVSSASIRLSNPEKIFTNPEKGVAFHPMDPITIFLERVQGYPVRVFTGYLDTTPYYQLIPGVVELKASCTLKKLLYTFFDPALPYVTSFLEKFGWINKGTGAIISSAAWGEAGEEVDPYSKNFVPFADEKGQQVNDGSLGKLLWAILYYIGNWKDEKIYIEELPAGLTERMAKLTSQFNQGNEELEEELNNFLQAIVGNGSYGSGGTNEGLFETSSGNIKEEKKIVEVMERAAQKYSLPPEFPLAVSWLESNWNGTIENSIGALGWFQFYNELEGKGAKQFSPYFAGETFTREEATNLGIVSAAFCKKARAVLQEDYNNEVPSNKLEWNEWANKIQKGGLYPNWTAGLEKAESALSKYGYLSGSKSKNNTENTSKESESGYSKNKKVKPSKGTTRIQEMINRANEITNREYEYAWGGGHSAGIPSYGEPGDPQGGGTESFGFDCTGATAAMLVAGGYIEEGTAVPSSGEFGTWLKGRKGIKEGLTSESVKPSVNIYANSEHAWMTINGRYFSANGVGDGAKWHEGRDGFEPSEFPIQFTLEGLEQESTVELPKIGSSKSVNNETEPENTENILGDATAAAFTAELAFPTIEEQIVAIALTGNKSLMNDESLMPFVQQVAQGSVRSFQSLPNGDFYAFYPDYFGEWGYRKPYWLIENIEILDGGIELTDDNLVTHSYATGDLSWPLNNEMINELFSAGVVTIFNAFENEGIIDREEIKEKAKEKAKGKTGLSRVMSHEEALEFLKRYGARPLKTDFPMVRSPVFETMMAYQQFMLAWSRQFLTPFTFTFMPEVFPGGLIGFPEHGLQMYVESVTHEWDLEDGFTTTAELSAPALLRDEGYENYSKEGLPSDMVSAMVEPLRGKTKKSQEKETTVK